MIKKVHKKGGYILPLILTAIFSLLIITNAPKPSTGHSDSAIVKASTQTVLASKHVSQPPEIKPAEPAKPPSHKKYPALGSATSERVTQAVEFYQRKGITSVGVAYLVGNFAWESGLRPTSSGDKGLAYGIAQWHPSRRVGLPNTLEGQMEFAWQEIQGYPLKDALYGTNEHLLMVGIKRYEGYSYEGNRFMFARQLLNSLRS